MAAIAITGGTGFVGRHLARDLVERGHDVVLIARGVDRRDRSVHALTHTTFRALNVDDRPGLTRALAGCSAVAHCAGINRERGAQTYEQVHVVGTRNVVDAARASGIQKMVLLSFLRARPTCGSRYHESKWVAEEIVRSSGLDYTVVKAGVIYGPGDHMLDRLSWTARRLPVFARVGLRESALRPTSVHDVVAILRAALVDGRLSRQVVAVLGPEPMSLSEALRRVGAVVGRTPWIVPLPVWAHYGLAWLGERLTGTPLASVAQVRMLAEGMSDALPGCADVPVDLAPRRVLDDALIREGVTPRR